MEEYENDVILGMEEDSEEVSTSSNDVGQSSENEISDSQIVDALRSLINENDIEGDNLSDISDSEENGVSDSQDIDIIDYSDILSDINDNLILINDKLDSIIEYHSATIFDRELNDYNITDSLLVLIVIFFFVKAIIHFVKVFTPRLWR